MTNQKSKTNKVLKAIEKQGFHVKNVTHLGGYFIFDHGKDMVVHFHIKECKGWLFGIWWDLEDKNRFTFFTQFEKTIDKFKPSASTYVVEDMTFSKDIDEEVEFKLKKIDCTKDNDGYMTLFPHEDDCDGFFISLMTKE